MALIDSAKQAACEVKNKYWLNPGFLESSGRPQRNFYVSDGPAWFRGLAKRFLGHPVKEVIKVNL